MRGSDTPVGNGGLSHDISQAAGLGIAFNLVSINRDDENALQDAHTFAQPVLVQITSEIDGSVEQRLRETINWSHCPRVRTETDTLRTTSLTGSEATRNRLTEDG